MGQLQQLSTPDVQARLITLTEAATKLLAVVAAAEAQAQIERAAFEARIAAIEKRVGHIPIQLHNSKIPYNSPLWYPVGIQVLEGMPILKRDIYNLLESDCITTADALKLPQLTGEPTIEQRRAQIREFFGAM